MNSYQEKLLKTAQYLRRTYFSQKNFSFSDKIDIASLSKLFSHIEEIPGIIARAQKHFRELEYSDSLFCAIKEERGSKQLAWFVDHEHDIEQTVVDKKDVVLLWLYLSIYSMLLLVCADFTSIPSRLKSYFSNDIVGINQTTTAYWFRGQPNDKWGLLPSIFRDWEQRPGTNTISFSDIITFYNKTGLPQKFDVVYGSTKPFDYESFMSFIQHSTACSPLVDFTKEVKVAGVFASHTPGNHLLETNHDGLVLAIPQGLQADSNCPTSSQSKAFEWAMSHYSILLLSGRVTPSTNVFGRPLYALSLSDLRPYYVTIEVPLNDRMKYQRGVLVFFYHGVIFGGTILFPFSNQYGNQSLRVAKIHKNLGKKRCYQKIVENSPWLDYDCLFDPYKYFLT